MNWCQAHLSLTPVLVFFFKPSSHDRISWYNSGDGNLKWRCFVTMHDKNLPIVPVAYWQRISCGINAINTSVSAGKIASGVRMTIQNVTYPHQSLS